MKDYNVSCEWFSLNYKDRQSLLDYLNKLNYNFYIDDSLINKNKKEIDETNKENKEIDKTNKENKEIETNKENKEIETNKNKKEIDETNKENKEIKTNKEEKIKLSKLSTEEIIKLFYENELKRLNNKLIFINSITNKVSTDYDYFLEKIDIENDLKKKEINELFKKLNKEYISCFEQLNNTLEEDRYLTLMINDLPNRLDDLIGMKMKAIYNIYSNKYDGKLKMNQLKKELKKLGYSIKRVTITIDDKVIKPSILIKTDNFKWSKEKVKKIYLELKDRGFDYSLQEIQDRYGINLFI